MTSPNHEVEPATDAEIAVLETRLLGPLGSSAFVDGIRKLIARIKSEQASQATAREQAIRECADFIRGFSTGEHVGHDIKAKIFPEQSRLQDAIADSVLELLQTGEETK